MIYQLKLRNFRNFGSQEFFFDKEVNGIYGNNGLGKSNIIEALSLLSSGELFGLEFDALVKEGESGFYIEILLASGEKLSLSYEKLGKKKRLTLNGKSTTKSKFSQTSFTSVVFHPLTLNMMYLAPSLRREYMDTILLQSFNEFGDIMKRYKEVLRSRNKFLQSIQEGKSKKEEITFWDQKFVELAVKIYEYRDMYSHYMKEYLPEYTYLLGDKVKHISFVYKTKIPSEQKEREIYEYLQKNLERDIILGVTHIGPHVDDFDIEIDGKSITSFASRGETKTVILGLKMLEAKFIEQKKGKKPVILIDDFLSEIDDIHKGFIFQTFVGYQTIITSILPLQSENQISSIYL